MSNGGNIPKERIALADSFLEQASVLRLARRQILPLEKEQEIYDTEREFLRQADRLYALDIVVRGQESKDAITALQSASERIEEFVKLVKNIEKILTVAGSILGIAVAVQTGTAGTILKAIRVFVEAVNDSDKETGKLGSETLQALDELATSNATLLSTPDSQ
ncbi:hypothetical protein [Pseudomonas sp. QTF5]|uniref:hypothetical protein n=1 Tax=Pseudomonas sp. QTF5 TaxID=1435425 RepID=UPI0004BE2D3D|nr:hypothetical protein [Pseudomonas sp. QTF5]